MTIENTNVRFYAYAMISEEKDIIEISEEKFIEFANDRYTIDYERHTIFENGVAQICLTIENSDSPIEQDENGNSIDDHFQVIHVK